MTGTGLAVERFERFDMTDETALLRVVGRWGHAVDVHLRIDDGRCQRRIPPLTASRTGAPLEFAVQQAHLESAHVAFALVDARGAFLTELPTPAEGAGDAKRAMRMLGRAMSRDASYYTVAMAAVFPIGIASALVATAYLPPGDYGRLGLLMVFASLVTVVYGLGTLQGTLIHAYGSAGGDGDGEDGGEDLAPDEQSPVISAQRRRRVLGDGMALTMLVAGAGTLVLISSAGPIAKWLGGSESLREGVIWAAVSAGLGALWRLAVQLYRLERRAPMYLVVSISRPLLALVLSFAFLSAGAGLEGVVAATALATAASFALAIGAAFRSYAWRLRGSEYGPIMRAGSPYIPMVTLLWVIGNADLYVLSRAAPAVEVGLYRLGSRLGVFPSYVTSAYLMAWMPMQRTSVVAAATRARSRAEVNSSLFTYFCLGSSGLLVLLAVASELFVGLAPPAYADAAPYVSAIAAAVVAQGAIYALYRVGRFRRRRTLYVMSMGVAAVVLVALGSILADPLGGYGVALAGLVGALAGAAIMVRAIGRGREPLPFEWRRITLAAVIGAGCVAIAVLARVEGVAAALIDLSVLVIFPVALVLTGVVRRDQLRDFASIARAAFPLRAGRHALVRRVLDLDETHREAVVTAVGPRGTSEGQPVEGERLARLTHGLRQVVGRERPTEHDVRIGEYLLYEGSNVDRDILGEELIGSGVDPLELHLLDDALQTLRQAPARAWRTNSKSAGTVSGLGH